MFNTVRCEIDQRCDFIIRVKREIKRVYRNGCRYNEILNTETGGSPKYLSACDRDERGRGEGAVCMCERVG